MSGPSTPPVPGNVNAVPIPDNTKALLVITMDEAGAIGVMGTLDQKLTVIGMLEIAKQEIFRLHAEMDKSGEKRIFQPPPGFARAVGLKRG